MQLTMGITLVKEKIKEAFKESSTHVIKPPQHSNGNKYINQFLFHQHSNDLLHDTITTECMSKPNANTNIIIIISSTLRAVPTYRDRSGKWIRG